ncbi:riboflavin biosynthesis protein RibF [Candidatus Viridilinea mediisalina]|uniref:Riboflavin biosynthesis protein n=2 Tax=Candidatus Viridilinea mediisalina TaxID=2024553 RepID=A0A2A6RIJ1_9CHLR|nr:riboflavin biosynthesis protein RibF [Candidatus Viridilinea mediisalina]
MGKFDGLHLGHQRLITTTIERAAALGLISAVLTWEPHPYAVLRPDQPLRLLTSLAEKIDLIAGYNPNRLIIAPFTRETMATSASSYMAQIMAAQPLRELWVGEGFAMGRARAGDVANLMLIGMEFGFAVGTVSKVIAADQPVSSSRIRDLLAHGAVGEVMTLLGRPFSLCGRVIKGDQRGRTIGFPTANLALPPEQILPADGVYACHAILDGTDIPAVTNIGVRPTFDGLRRTVEAYLLNWSGDLYGQTLRLEFHAHLRGEQKFPNIEALVKQIKQDVSHAQMLL